MKKRLLCILIFGISIAPAIFADEAQVKSLFPGDRQLAEKSAALVAKPGQMAPEREVYFCSGDGMWHSKLAPKTGDQNQHQVYGASRAEL